MEIAADYWASRYTDPKGAEHHSKQNTLISADLLKHAAARKEFVAALGSERIIEIGCGTGELAAQIAATYATPVYYATDFSRAAIAAAKARHDHVNFWVFDVLRDRPFARFDLLISSNTLEHFSSPRDVIERMLQIAPLVMLAIPYKQPVTDSYEAEGGAGHAVELNLATFDPYTIIDYFVFRTVGWQYSSGGELPQQLAVLIRAKD